MPAERKNGLSVPPEKEQKGRKKLGKRGGEPSGTPFGQQRGGYRRVSSGTRSPSLAR